MRHVRPVEQGALAALRGKINILLMEDGNVHDHPMVRELADYIVDDVDDAIHLVRAII